MYPEEGFAALFAGAVSVLGVDGNKAQELFADYFMEVSRTLFSAIFTVSGSTKNFLLQLPHPRGRVLKGLRIRHPGIAVEVMLAIVVIVDQPEWCTGSVRLIHSHVGFLDCREGIRRKDIEHQRLSNN